MKDSNALPRLSALEKKYLAGIALSESKLRQLCSRDVHGLYWGKFYLLIGYEDTFIKIVVPHCSIRDSECYVAVTSSDNNFKDILKLNLRYMLDGWFLFDEPIDSLMLNNWSWIESSQDCLTLTVQASKLFT
jgi:hypothetical protein